MDRNADPKMAGRVSRVDGVIALQNPPRDGEGDRRATRGGGGGSPSLRRPEIYEARRARRELSIPEALLWQRLKGAPNGIRFRKQHPIGAYRADFYCAAARLVIEVDGVAHDMGDRPQRDAVRNASLEQSGYRVLRISAVDVLLDIDAVADAIVSSAASPLHPAFGAVPLPVNGEDF
ncbi:conserved hypothetical protein [Sphingomonas sp. AX6]|nr:conserved hypothetical protein [Sphingomonas sp. AX6]